MEPDDAIERKLELFGPTSKEVDGRRLDTLLQRFFTSPLESSEVGDETQRGEVVSLDGAPHRRRSHWWRRASLTGAIGMVRPPPPQSNLEMITSFELQLYNGWSDMRGTEDSSGSKKCDQRYHKNYSLSARLLPIEAVGEGLSVAALARPMKGEPRWLKRLSVTQGDKGVITIEQPVQELGLTPGIWTITFFVVRRGEPLASSALRELERGTYPGVSVVSGSVCIVE